jgi:succinoglycan biosynthesis transport protein ExoP
MTSDPSGNRGPRPAIDLMEYWEVILKRKWTVLAFAVPLIVLVTILSFVIKPTYTAEGTLLIEKEPNILSFEDILQIETFNDDYFQTQYKLLQSRTLAGNVIEGRKLFENERFAGSPKGDKAELFRDDAGFRSRLITMFLDRLSINPVRTTRLVAVSFKDGDPEFAADMVNALFDSFIEMNIEAKFEATAQATAFLTDQIDRLRNEIGKDEQTIQTYGADKNIIPLSDKETTIIEKLGELNRALTEAQIERVNKQTYYNSIKDVAPEFIPEALANPLIQRLREDYNKLNREYLKMQDRFKEDYPELQRLKTELESARKSLEAEAQNLQKGAYSDWQASLQREWSLSAAFDAQKKEAIQLNSNAISYNQLKIELENKKSLLENLLRRQSETGVSARLKGLRTSNVRIVDKAEAPPYPTSPKKKLNIALALLLGIFGGIGLAFLFERLDDSIKTFDDVTKSTSLPSLGIIPAFGGDVDEVRAWEGFLPENWRFWRPKRERRDEAPRAPIEGTKPEATLETIQGESAGNNGAPEVVGKNGVSAIDLISFSSPKSNIAESYRSARPSSCRQPSPGPNASSSRAPCRKKGRRPRSRTWP